MPTTSLSNERVKYVRSLHRERVRTREGRFIIEGTRLVEEALSAGARPVLAFYTERLAGTERGRALLERITQTGGPLIKVTGAVMSAVSETVTPQGILAVMPLPAAPWPSGGLVVVLDSLRDPGNAGTILRTAWAAGAAAVVTTHGTVDLFSPKVVRAAMGAHYHLALRSGLSLQELAELLSGRCVLLATQDGRPYWEVDWGDDPALIIGGEARGSEVAASLARERVTIPMAAEVESLNAAIAAGVLLFDALRRRSTRG